MNTLNKKASLITPGYIVTFILVVCLFFLWSWPNTLNDFLITQFKKSLELSLAQTGFLPFALKTGYFCLAIPAGLYMQRKGYKAGILMGLILFAAGCLLFYPAASTQKFTLFLCGIFVMAGGCAFLEIGANSFVVSLGDKETSERRLNLAQSFNPIGSIIASTSATLFIFSGNEPDTATIQAWKDAGTYEAFLKEENARVFPVYIALATIVLIIAFLISRAKFPQVETEKKTQEKGKFKVLLKFPHWWGAIISQFFYLGAQLGTWSFIVLYITQNSNLGEKAAGWMLTANMIIFMIGRFFSTWIMKFFKPTRLMGTYAIINLCLISIAILGSKWGEAKFGLGLSNIILSIPFTNLSVPVGIYTLILTAFFMSLMYPTNFASGVKGLGDNTKLGASILVMSLIGGAIGSLIISKLAGTGWGAVSGLNEHQIASGMCYILLAYIVIAWYAFRGSRPRGPIC
jgi:FHS family L-fucose permease-like MFS transporter